MAHLAKKVLVYSELPGDLIEKLKETFEVRYIPGGKDISDLLPDLTEADGLLGSWLRAGKELLDHAPALKIISNITVGYDNLDIPLLTERGIMATNTPGVLDETTADTIFGLMLAAARRFTELDRLVKNRELESACFY